MSEKPECILLLTCPSWKDGTELKEVRIHIIYTPPHFCQHKNVGYSFVRNVAHLSTHTKWSYIPEESNSSIFTHFTPSFVKISQMLAKLKRGWVGWRHNQCSDLTGILFFPPLLIEEVNHDTKMSACTTCSQEIRLPKCHSTESTEYVTAYIYIIAIGRRTPTRALLV